MEEGMLTNEELQEIEEVCKKMDYLIKNGTFLFDDDNSKYYKLNDKFFIIPAERLQYDGDYWYEEVALKEVLENHKLYLEFCEEKIDNIKYEISSLIDKIEKTFKEVYDLRNLVIK